ncbi:MAG: hypothetical protein GY772_00720 [bacterium]|nr:hypothetical protein [bacterium]
MPPVAAVCDIPPSGTVAFTDASAFGGDDPPAARAGWAFSDADGVSSYGPLPGPDQSVDRAELYALVRCTAAPSVLRRVFSDSTYVVRGAASAAAGIHPTTNGDLWEQYRFGPVHPHVDHVPAHLTPAQAVLRGVPEHVRLGNEVADRFARIGALAHAFSPAYYAARKAALALAGRVQQYHWQFLREVLKAEGRQLRVAQRARGWLRLFGPRRRPGLPPHANHGAHAIAPSGAGYQCRRCHRVSRSARPRAWRFRPCVAPQRQHRAGLATSHLIWRAPRRVGCWACGRQVGIRNQARLLASPCLRRCFGKFRLPAKRSFISLLASPPLPVPSGSYCIRLDADGPAVKRRLCQKTFVVGGGEASHTALAGNGTSAFPVPLRRDSGHVHSLQASPWRDCPPHPSGESPHPVPLRRDTGLPRHWAVLPRHGFPPWPSGPVGADALPVPPRRVTWVASPAQVPLRRAAFSGPLGRESQAWLASPLWRDTGHAPSGAPRLTQAPLRRDSPPWPSGHASSDRQEARACPPTQPGCLSVGEGLALPAHVASPLRRDTGAAPLGALHASPLRRDAGAAPSGALHGGNSGGAAVASPLPSGSGPRVGLAAPA